MGIERTLRRSMAKSARKSSVRLAKGESGRKSIPANVQMEAKELRNKFLESLKEAPGIGKGVAGSMSSPSDIFHALVSTGKYDRCIAEARWHIKSGVKVLNLVARGYKGEPAASIVNFIINSAMHESGSKIQNGMSDAILRKMDVESGADLAGSEAKNVAALNDMLFGPNMHNNFNDRNYIVDWTRVQVPPSEDEEPTHDSIYRGMAQARRHDIVYDPENPMSYTYLGSSVSSSADKKSIKMVSDIEATATGTRNEWKASGKPMATIGGNANSFSEIAATINQSLGINPTSNEAYVPYSAPGSRKNPGGSSSIESGEEFKSLFKNLVKAGVDKVEARYRALEFIGARIRNSAFSASTGDNNETVVRYESVLDMSSDLTPDQDNRVPPGVDTFLVTIPTGSENLAGSGSQPMSMRELQNIIGVKVAGSDTVYSKVSATESSEGVMILFAKNSPESNELRKKLDENGGEITLVMAGSSSNEEYGENAQEVLSLQKKLGVRINRGVLPNWAPDIYDYRPATGRKIGNANNLYGVRVALDKRIRARDVLKAKAKTGTTSANAEIMQNALAQVEDEIAEINDFLAWVKKQNGDKFPDVSDVRNSSASLLKYSKDNASWISDDIVSECKKAGLNVPMFNDALNEKVVVDYLNKHGDPGDAKKFSDICKSVLSKYGRIDGKKKPVAVVLSGIDTSPVTGFGNGLVTPSRVQDGQPTGGEDGAKKKSSKPKYELDFSASMVDMMTNYVAQATASNDSSCMFMVTEIPMPDKIADTVSVGVVHVDVHIVSQDEIRKYIHLYSERIKDQYKKENADDAQKVAIADAFFLPETFAMGMTRDLAGLSSSKVSEFIRGIVGKLFNDFMNFSGDMDQVITTNESSISKEVSDMAIATQDLGSINVEVKTPSVTVDQYVTKTGSDWDKFMNDTFGKVISRLKSAQNKVDVMCRLYDCGIVPVSFPVRDASEIRPFFEGEQFRRVSFVKLSGGALAPAKTSESLARKFVSAFGGNVGISEYTPVPQSGDVDTTSLYKSMISKVKNQITVYTNDIQMIKREISPLFFLYGPPGSGKTIFGDVLASALGLKYNFCKLQEVYYAGRSSMFRGQSENNLHDFFAYCRNAVDTVMIVDEFNKPFEGGDSREGSGTSDMAKKILDAMMGSLEEDKGAYVSNLFYFVLTSNKSPDWLKKHTESAPFFSRIGQIGMAEEVDVPNDFDSLKRLFTTEAMVNNMINLICEDPAVAAVVNDLMRARASGDEEKYKALSDKLLEMKPNIVNQGVLNPHKAKLSYLESVGIQRADSSANGVNPVDNFIDGFILMRDKFLGMSENMPGKNYSPLDMICHKMNERMVWEKKVGPQGDKEIPTTGVRDLNGVIKTAFLSHDRFMAGDRNAVPVNAETLYWAMCLQEWKNVPDEFKNNPELEKLKEKRQDRNGWAELEKIARSEDIGIPIQFFHSDEDRKYLLETAREAMVDKLSLSNVDSDYQVMCQYIETVAPSALMFLNEQYDKTVAAVASYFGKLKGNEEIVKFCKDIVPSRRNMMDVIDALYADGLEDEQQEEARIDAVMKSIVVNFGRAVEVARYYKSSEREIQKSLNDFGKGMDRTVSGDFQLICNNFFSLIGFDDFSTDMVAVHDASQKMLQKEGEDESESGISPKVVAEAVSADSVEIKKQKLDLLTEKIPELTGVEGENILSEVPPEKMVGWLNKRMVKDEKKGKDTTGAPVSVTDASDVLSKKRGSKLLSGTKEKPVAEVEKPVDEQEVEEPSSAQAPADTAKTPVTEQPVVKVTPPEARTEDLLGDAPEEVVAPPVQEAPAVPQPIPAPSATPKPEPVQEEAPDSEDDILALIEEEKRKRSGVRASSIVTRIKSSTIDLRKKVAVAQVVAPSAAPVTTPGKAEGDRYHQMVAAYLSNASTALEMLHGKRGTPSVTDQTMYMTFISG